MRALRVVGITEGGGELSVVLEDSGRQERFTVAADEQLRAAARGDLTRLGQIAIELESQLRPREIQARIRAGASVDQVAAAAGVPAQKIERFAYPVLLERSRTAEVAQRAHPMRADGPDGRMLADVVAHTFGLRGQEYASAEWDSWKGDDGRWVIALSWRAGRSDNRALWAFQPGAHGGTVTAIDEHAHDLVEGLPARPLRTVGPVIEISRPDEQEAPAPEEGHELRAAASDIAARRDVSDWSRVAPEQRRPESRRPRSEPGEALHRESRESYARPGRADEPATEWPAPQRQSEQGRSGDAVAPVDRGGRRDDPRADDHGRADDRADDPAADAATERPPWGDAAATAPARPSGTAPAGTAGGSTGTPAGDTPGAVPAAATPASSTSAVSGAPAGPTATTFAEGLDGAQSSGAAEPTTAGPPPADPSPRTGAPQTGASTEGAPQAEAAVPSARSPQPDPAPDDHGPAAAEGAGEAAPTDRAPAEPPAPRQAEPEAATAPQQPRRNRKGKPVMPSWDEVLLGVRSQR